MKQYKTAEYVAQGHPDKIADCISSYILDRCLEQDPMVKYALEVLVKDNTIVLAGEIKGNVDIDSFNYVYDALVKVGYGEEYHKIWGENALNINKINVMNLIGQQSEEINQGLSGWGDQGVFVGYANKYAEYDNMPEELFLAKKLGLALYKDDDKNLGLDIKTQITLEENSADIIHKCIVAVPMLEAQDITDKIKSILESYEIQEIIVNGTGSYTQHSSVADAGITGRKLAVDFYSTSSPIGGGSPWTKDPSKADLTLNIYARKLALENIVGYDECFVYLSSCIGKAELMSADIKLVKDGVITKKSLEITKTPEEIINELELRKPIYMDLCKKGLFSKI